VSFKTAIGAGVVLAVAGYAVLTGMTPFYHEHGGTSRDPESVTLEVSWSTGGGVRFAEVAWGFTGERTASEHASGGHWRRDIRLPGKGTYVVTLAGAPVAVKVDDGKGGTLKKSATSTCTITRMAGRKRDIHPAMVGEGCSITDVVIVP
jgi:hypothetical protein